MLHWLQWAMNKQEYFMEQHQYLPEETEENY
jgi:hypothetical protein